MQASPITADERAAVEREIHEAIKTIRYTLDDLAALVERSRQLRQADAGVGRLGVRDHSLVIRDGNGCARPEVAS